MRFQHNPFTDKLDISGMGPGTTSVDFVTGNSGGTVAADSSYNINLLGDNTTGINTIGNITPNTLTFFGLASTTSQIGTTRYATNVEAAAQSSTTTALTPSNITSLFSVTPLPASQGGTGRSSPAAHSLVVTNGSSAFTLLGTASNGQIPIGSIGSDPVLANITSLGGTIGITNGPGSINLEQIGGGGDVVGPGSATDNAIARYDGTTGKLIQNSTVIVSDVGNVFTPGSLYVGTATPSNPFDITIEKSVSGLIGSSIQNVSNNASAGSVQEIIVQTATADAYTEYVVNGATTWSTGIDNSDSDKYKITTGASPSAGTAAVTIDTSGVLSLSTALGIASGGTGATSFNINGVAISNTTTTGALASLTLTNGQMVIGSTGAAPVAGTITSTDSSITVSTGAGTLNLAVAGGTTTGKTITGTTGGALSPTAGNWNFLGATAIAGTTPVKFAGAVSTETCTIQLSQAIAATDATKVGLSNFDSARFTVDANGFVSTNTAGIGQTITGTTGGALSPTSGNWTFLGATAAAGTTPVKFAGAVSTETCTIQFSQAIASTDATKVGLATFNSSNFSVDANGFVSLTSGGGFTFTDQSGTFTAAVNNGYFLTAAATPTLPASPSQGDRVAFIADTSGSVVVTANTGQKIRIANLISSLAGTATNTLQGDALFLVYRSTGATWFSEGSPAGGWTTA